ncbi:MAG: hypothetical protein LBJ46_06165 [Planctomycetota bacterium]|jgi:uncharacterized repeat protein (TIGR03943 family)|nr:hypothetical protein [Planctomycetota bacterium]
MKTLIEAARRWRLPLVCFLWMFCLLGLLARRRYETFLTANFLPILALAVMALLPMTLCALLRRASPRFGAREALATAIVLLPLVYIRHADGITLGASALQTRYVGTGALVNRNGSSADLAVPEDTSLLTLFLDADKFEGKDVTLVGMLAKGNPQVVELLGEKRPLIFRFVINCCAADAAPIALVLEGNVADSMRDDDWIEATGRFRVRKVDRFELLVLEEATIRPTAAPSQPYLYSLW